MESLGQRKKVMDRIEMVRDNVGEMDYLFNFGLVFQKLVYLYSWFLSTVNQGDQHDIAVRLKSMYTVFFW